MKRVSQLTLLLLAIAASCVVGRAGDVSTQTQRPSAEEIMNFSLLDYKGKSYELRRTDARVVVLFFTGNGCPVARQSIKKLKALRKHFADKGLAVWMINSNTQDDRQSIEH